MASYQEMESRLRTVEDLLLFVAQNFKMKAMRGNGLIGPDGRPQGEVFEASLLDLYRLSKNMATFTPTDEEKGK